MCDFDDGFETNAGVEGVSRRHVTFGATSAIVASFIPGTATASNSSLVERIVEIDTEYGKLEAFLTQPSFGRHPAVLMWPDIAGLRPAYEEMARRLAMSGFVVIVPNIYFRVSRLPVFYMFYDWRSAGGQQRFEQMSALMGPREVQSISKSLISFLTDHPQATSRNGIAAIGYCLGGAWAVQSAASVPSKVKVVASFHGFGLVNQTELSPHLLVKQTSAAYLFEVAKNDDEKDPRQKLVLAQSGGPHAKVDVVVRQADHGWCTFDAPTYSQAASDESSVRLRMLLKSL